MRLNELNSIKVNFQSVDGEKSTRYISYKQYEKSFIDEKWQGERRYKKVHSVFGLNPSLITVNNGYGGISRRWFDFPCSIEEAQENHRKSLENK